MIRIEAQQRRDHVDLAGPDRMLRIVLHELEAVGVLAIVERIEVVRPRLGKARARPVAIARVVRDDHVIDEVVDVQQLFEAGLGVPSGLNPCTR